MHQGKMFFLKSIFKGGTRIWCYICKMILIKIVILETKKCLPVCMYVIFIQKLKKKKMKKQNHVGKICDEIF